MRSKVIDMVQICRRLYISRVGIIVMAVTKFLILMNETTTHLEKMYIIIQSLTR